MVYITNDKIVTVSNQLALEVGRRSGGQHISEIAACAES